MIKKIKKIKNLGIFSDFVWESSLSEFKQFNLIYGWNGCGKTTLSRLFATLKTGSSEKYPNLEYQLDSDGVTFKQGQAYPQTVMVFNQEYITENAPSLEDPQTKTKHIYILGKEDKELSVKIKDDKAEKTRLENLLNNDNKKEGIESLNTKKIRIENSTNKLFTVIASTIASSRGRAFRDYNRTDAIKVYKSLSKKNLLNDKEKKKYQSVVEQKVQDKINPLKLPEIAMPVDEKVMSYQLGDALKIIIDTSNALLMKTAQQKVIDRLKDNPDIADWVAKGFLLHSKHKSISCEYCSQKISEERSRELSECFNKSYNAIVDSIDHELEKVKDLRSKLNDFGCVDKTNLYEHLRIRYEKEKVELKTQKELLLDRLTVIETKLNDKKLKVHKSFPQLSRIDPSKFEEKLELINGIIDDHNKISDDFDHTIIEAKAKLEKHYISTIYDDVENYEKDLKDTNKQIQDTTEKITELNKKIAQSEAKSRNSKIACDRLNTTLEKFLGRNEITFEDSENGYQIKRLGELAEDISEGEKAAISLVYFIINLECEGVDITKSIVVIDDPVSSLDTSMLFRACSFIEVELKKANQLFILTHNYDFLNQLKKWMYTLIERDTKEKQYRFLMIDNMYNGDTKKRVAKICNLDKLLADYESEYHYLFAKLFYFERDNPGNTTSIGAIYNYPNMARKMLECFLAYRIPNNQIFKAKLNNLYDLNKKINKNDLNQIYNFANSHSHLDTKTGLLQFDPTLNLNGKKSIELILKIIKQADKKHFEFMKNSID
ncbi:MAG: AAA family ATPase [Patescibacteria group bacterium]